MLPFASSRGSSGGAKGVRLILLPRIPRFLDWIQKSQPLNGQIDSNREPRVPPLQLFTGWVAAEGSTHGVRCSGAVAEHARLWGAGRVLHSVRRGTQDDGMGVVSFEHIHRWITHCTDLKALQAPSSATGGWKPQSLRRSLPGVGGGRQALRNPGCFSFMAGSLKYTAQTCYWTTWRTAGSLTSDKCMHEKSINWTCSFGLSH